MLSFARSDATTVRRLRVRVGARDFDPVSTKLSLERMLGNVELPAPWLSPSAILCIRELRDPRPGALALDELAIRPPPAWHSALLAAVEEKLRRAVRPALGAVPAGAEAVVFADRAELLACLARDVVLGGAGAWWWSALFGSRDLARLAAAELAAHAELAPAVFARLVAESRAAAFVAELEEGEVTLVLARTLASFGLAHVERVVTGASAPPGVKRGDAQALLGAGEASSSLHAWSDEIEAHLGALEGTARLLVGIALAIASDPVQVRSQSFAAALERRIRDRAEPPEVIRSFESSLDSPRLGARSEDAEQPNGERFRYDAAARAPLPAQSAVSREAPLAEAIVARASPAPESRAAAPAPAAEPAAPTEETRARPFPAAPASPPLEKPGESRRDAGEVAPALRSSESSREARLEPQPDAVVSVEPRSAVDELRRVYGEPVVTELGGAFYLVNVALALGLYPDFTRPAEAGIALSVWDFIALLGEALLGGERPDPLWALLARLAGRAPEAKAGAGFVPPAAQPIPASWPAVGEPYPPQPDLDGWLRFVATAVRARLKLALRLDSEEAIAEVLLERPARVHATDGHVDVIFALDDLPIAIRAAGLDRDPGFLPAAARSVAFHFR